MPGSAHVHGAAPSVRLRHPAAGHVLVKVGPGEHHVSADRRAAISTVLGSCVAACICDPEAGVGGLNHFMLPASHDGVWGQASASLRYGNFAMEQLINDLLLHGAQRARLQVKLFGGARMAHDSGGIGERNARFAEAYLAAEGLVPLVRELGGTQARRVIYIPVGGRAFSSVLPHALQAVALQEVRFGRTLRRQHFSGTVELFE